MIYLSPNNRTVKDGGRLYTPQRRPRTIAPGIWAADNAQYTQTVTILEYMRWLGRVAYAADRCLFAAAPDVVGNAVATLDYFRLFAWKIKALGYPVALVAQDGMEALRWPPEIDALFVGGSTEWKMGRGALWCIAEAKRRGAWVHVGRVNTQKRIRHFQLADVDSVDGTATIYHPSRKREIEAALQQKPLMRIP